MARGETAQDGVERVARYLRLEPAQHVVGAKLENDGLGALRHRPVEPGQPISGGIAGDAGVLDFRGNAFGGKGCLQARHKTFVVGQAVAGGQRVAEGDDFHRRLGVRRRHRCRGEQRHATNRRTGDLDERAPPPI